MGLPIPDRERTLRVLDEVSDRFSALVRSVRDPGATAIGHWTILQTAKHASHIYGLFPTLLEGGSSPVHDHRKLAEAWERHLAEDDESDLGRIADRITAAAKGFQENIARAGWEDVVNWHGGLKVPAYTLACILINEGAIHGLDIAGAEDRPWTIAPEQARFAIQGLFPVLPHFVKEDAVEGLDVLYELRVRGSDPIGMHIHDGGLTIGETDGKGPDCRISAAPVDYLLIGYGRKSQWGAILTGRVIAYGRKPWLGFKFGNLFVSP